MPPYTKSILNSAGLEFHIWPGASEDAATFFGISHTAIIPSTSRRVIIGGQVGIKDDGTVPSDIFEEIDVAFEHVERALKAAGLPDNAWEFVFKVYTPFPLYSLSLFALFLLFYTLRQDYVLIYIRADRYAPSKFQPMTYLLPSRKRRIDIWEKRDLYGRGFQLRAFSCQICTSKLRLRRICRNEYLVIGPILRAKCGEVLWSTL